MTATNATPETLAARLAAVERALSECGQLDAAPETTGTDVERRVVALETAVEALAAYVDARETRADRLVERAMAVEEALDDVGQVPTDGTDPDEGESPTNPSDWFERAAAE